MRKLSLLFVLMISIVSVKAHGNHSIKSDFNLKLWNNSSFKIIVDNYHYNNENFFKLNNIQPGIHHVKVIKRKKNAHGYGMFTQVLYNGTVNIPRNSRVMATVTPHRKLNLKIIKKHRVGQYHNQHNHNQCVSTCGQTNGNNWGNNQCGNYYNVMSQHSFNQLIKTMNNASFDSRKMNIAKQVIQQNNFSTEQVIALVNQFTFDSSRLKLAKLAYLKTLDKENYFLVNNSFTFNSSVDQLNEYINQVV